jgi:hypothetical protein
MVVEEEVEEVEEVEEERERCDWKGESARVWNLLVNGPDSVRSSSCGMATSDKKERAA